MKKKKIEIPNTLDFEKIPDDVLLLIFEKFGLRYNLDDAEKSSYDYYISFMCKGSDNDITIHSNFLNGDVVFPEVIEDASGLCGFCIDNVFYKLSRVCKRFKALIEKHHLFLKLKFFESARTKKEYELLLDSTRRYHALTFSLQEDAQMQFHYLKEFLKSQRNLEMAQISLDDGSIHQASDLKDCLEHFKYVKSLFIDIGSASIISNQENCLVTFPNLTRLVIKGLNESMCSNLQEFIDAPNLKCLKIALTGAVNNNDEVYSDWVEIMSLVHHFSSSLQHFHIFNFENSNEVEEFMNWSPESLLIHNISGPNNQLIEFLRGKLANCKSVEVKNCINNNINNLICREAENMEELNVDFDFLNNIDYSMRMYSVKKLHICDNDFVEDFLNPVMRVFPNAVTVVKLFV